MSNDLNMCPHTRSECALRASARRQESLRAEAQRAWAAGRGEWTKERREKQRLEEEVFRTALYTCARQPDPTCADMSADQVAARGPL